MEPCGVGEVFLIAGQSYAAGWNQELTRVEDPAGRAAADVQRLVEIRQAAAKRWGFEPPWLSAKSTLNPTV